MTCLVLKKWVINGYNLVGPGRMSFHSRYLTCVAALFLLSGCAQSQAANSSQHPLDSTGGKEIFASNCSSCHGIDGKGSERAPDIADSPSMKRRSNSEISEIIRNGIPSAGMPAFHALTDSELEELVLHLRVLQGPDQSSAMTGDPVRGKSIFFGKGECAHCHMMAGEGGFIASDLSEYARVHSPEQVQEVILHPPAFRMTQSVTVILKNGQKYEGRIRNEDNFSVQLQSRDGMFHSIARSGIKKIEPAPQLVMPTSYASRLSASEINDLVAYVSQIAGAPNSAETKKKDDFDDADQ